MRAVVERFGERLKNVSLLAPADQVRNAIRREYAELVTSDLLQRWLADPAQAPGRLTSSPWPERVEITRIRAHRGRFEALGEIVEISSANGEARRTPVRIEVVPQNDQWRIAGWSPADARESEEPDARAAVEVIEAYYGLISERAYGRAYSMWADGGRASGKSREEFRSGFANTERVTVDIGTPGRVEGAAGSRYVTLPVKITATTGDGKTQRFAGSYVLRRSVVDGATGEQRSWRIASAKIRPVIPLAPVDEGPRDASFSAYRRNLLEVVRRKDVDGLLAAVDPRIRTTFGDGGGRDDLAQRWQIGDPNSKLWGELQWILTHGGSFRGEGEKRMFWAPYIYSEWPDTIDAFTALAVVGTDVALRAEPRAGAEILERLSHEIVTARSEPKDGWRQVETAGTRGWVETRHLRSPIDYRAGFVRGDRGWRMVALVAGD